jgi:hypothetical protein
MSVNVDGRGENTKISPAYSLARRSASGIFESKYTAVMLLLHE